MSCSQSVKCLYMDLDARFDFAPLNVSNASPFEVHLDNLLIDLPHGLFLRSCQSYLTQNIEPDSLLAELSKPIKTDSGCFSNRWDFRSFLFCDYWCFSDFIDKLTCCLFAFFRYLNLRNCVWLLLFLFRFCRRVLWASWSFRLRLFRCLL